VEEFMSTQNRVHACGVALALVVLASSTASAQVLGTFRWQFAPFCNVVQVQVEQKGAVFELTGTEDGCTGAAPASTANGSAHFNSDNSVGMSLTLIRPDGYVVNNAITLDPGSLSGAWRDDWGNSGTFTFSPPPQPAGSTRPLTMRGEFSLSYSASTNLDQGTSSVSFPRPLPSAPGVNIIRLGDPPTANCPGSAANPQAAPGHLCIYERQRNNVAFMQVFDAGNATPGFANTTGFTIHSIVSAVGSSFLYGRWAVTVP
jgi:hypothetical protein